MIGRSVRRAATIAATDLILDAVAVARLTRLVQIDEVWPLPELRAAFLRRVGETSRAAELVHCPWCLGTWCAAGAVAARAVAPRTWTVVARVLAGSAAAGLLSRVVDG